MSEYLTKEFSATVSKRIMAQLFSRFSKLASFPQLGQRVEGVEESIHVGGFYWWKLPRNSILYDLNQKKGKIQILRVLGNQQDVVKEIQNIIQNIH